MIDKQMPRCTKHNARHKRYKPYKSCLYFFGGYPMGKKEDAALKKQLKEAKPWMDKKNQLIKSWAGEIRKEADYVDGLYADLQRLGAPVGKSCSRRLRAMASRMEKEAKPWNDNRMHDTSRSRRRDFVQEGLAYVFTYDWKPLSDFQGRSPWKEQF